MNPFSWIETICINCGKRIKEHTDDPTCANFILSHGRMLERWNKLQLKPEVE